MKIEIHAKDTTDILTLDVSFYYQEGNCFTFITDSGIRMYPMTNIWYIKVLNKEEPKQLLIETKNMDKTTSTNINYLKGEYTSNAR